MNHQHEQPHGQAYASGAGQNRGRLLAVLGLTTAFLLAEAVAGVMANSLALLADAGHMLTDVAGLSLALLAIWFAQRPANDRRTFGYYRLEILAAMFNAVILLVIAGFILYEAYQRLMDPPEVQSLPILIVASAGLVVNLISVWFLMEASKQSLNMKGAFLEVVSDGLSSAGAIAAGLIVLTTGWRYADPLFAAAIGVFILPRTWALLRSALSVLLESAPASVSVPEMSENILALPGVRGVHDLHVWTITSGFIAMSGHILVEDEVDHDHLIVDVRRLLHDRFDIEHVTLQVETQRLEQELEQPCLPGTSPCYVDDNVATAARGALS
ncbi:MAG: cation diffusion facilitator family transporter [Dehalococcoidia bacterium]|nr:cation diffusion facilitator family transporter [Dehalococcoidia bacterium]